VHVVVNHLHLRDPVSEATLRAAEGALPFVVESGALSAQVVKVDDRHLILLLHFATEEDAERVAREVGPWMRDRIVPLLARDPERSVGEVIAASTLTDTASS